MITQAELHEILNYDPATGDFVWKRTVNRNARVGEVAGYARNRDGYQYLVIGLSRRTYQAHRLAFLYMKGVWPIGLVDHKDGDGPNNRWTNLREATLSLNAANAKRPSTNTSGFKGVTFNKSARRWQAQIKKDGRSIYLGLFDKPEDGHAAYAAKAKEMFGEFARLK